MRAMTMEPPTMPTYERELAVGRLRGEWGDVLALSCNDTLTGPRPQLVSRHNRPAAVIVSTGWYGQARNALGTAPEVQLFSSDNARTELTRILTDVAEHGHHIVIKVDRYEVVALVPVSWHQLAVQALANTSNAAED
ncbi:hypothetical protein [Streptomyces sp. x-45]|uniref:hypothetical protein n=1 Tax=Streptomyces sp. x-45 TaxID=2789281 RepID=UPI00397FB5C5